MAEVECPAGHINTELRRFGVVTRKAGQLQRWQCRATDGSNHLFTTPLQPKRQRWWCPQPEHVAARVTSAGTRRSNTGTVRRVRCVPLDGPPHTFTVPEPENHPTEPAPPWPAPSKRPPPPCPWHPEGYVVRDGGYGGEGRGSRKRQRYLCRPHGRGEDADKHSFAPPLSREKVTPHSACATCDELLSPHAGTLTAARHTSWVLHQQAFALNELSMGASYSQTGLLLRERRGDVLAHLATHETDQEHPEPEPRETAKVPQELTAHDGPEVADDGSGEPETESKAGPLAPSQERSISASAQDGRSAWQLAANLVEQYAPLLYGEVTERIRAREADARATNDAQLADSPDEPLLTPLTYVLDELPVYIRSTTDRVRRSYSLLVVTEVAWEPRRTSNDPVRHHNRLRLARVYPRSDATAWRLVLDELGVRPDFVIADAADAIRLAVAKQWDGQTQLIPSLFHARRNLRKPLADGRRTSHVVEGRRRVLPELGKHLARLDRDELVNLTPADWAAWWDDLATKVAALGAPVETLIAQRRTYEDRIGDAIPLLRTHPHLPASNAAVENRIRQDLDPFLTNRKQAFRNLARTNFLFDLAVCRAQGAFTDLADLAERIRVWNEQAGGWAPQPRVVVDTQPAGTTGPQRYSSLLNPLLVPALAKTRSIT